MAPATPTRNPATNLRARPLRGRLAALPLLPLPLRLPSVPGLWRRPLLLPGRPQHGQCARNLRLWFSLSLSECARAWTCSAGSLALLTSLMQRLLAALALASVAAEPNLLAYKTIAGDVVVGKDMTVTLQVFNIGEE